MAHPLKFDGDHAILDPHTDPASVLPIVAARLAVPPSPGMFGEQLSLQFEVPLPARLLQAVGGAVEAFPDLLVHAYDRADPSLAWLEHLPTLRHLSVDLWNVTDFSPIADLGELRTLTLGGTARTRPSLDFLRRLRELRSLYLEAHGRDFDAIADLPRLQELTLYASRTPNFDALSGHPSLESLRVSFGRVRDLRPLASIPHLVGLDLYRIRLLQPEDLAPLTAVASLRYLGIDALPHIHDLRFIDDVLRHGLRMLVLGDLTGLESYLGVEEAVGLRGFVHTGRAPTNADLSPLLAAAHLEYVSLCGRFGSAESARFARQFRGGYAEVGDLSVERRPPEARVAWPRFPEAFVRSRPDRRHDGGSAGRPWLDLD